MPDVLIRTLVELAEREPDEEKKLLLRKAADLLKGVPAAAVSAAVGACGR